jgi:hypothetical protein
VTVVVVAMMTIMTMMTKTMTVIFQPLVLLGQRHGQAPDLLCRDGCVSPPWEVLAYHLF